jgi:surface polysaccharide O-acyltransferase-like enzyme
MWTIIAVPVFVLIVGAICARLLGSTSCDKDDREWWQAIK